MNTWQGQAFKSFAVFGPLSYWSPAPFGRYSIASRFTVPGKPAWVIQESTLLVSFLYYAKISNAWQLTLAIMLVVHYVHRAIIWPIWGMPSMSDNHLLPMCGAILWNYLNGFLQASGISTSTPSMLRGTIGILLFVVGGYGNYWHDQVLAELRRSSTEKYGIPRGGLYEYISFPNYFCEWIEWTGYAICQNQAPGYWFVFLEVMVMAPRALTGHRWYRDKFGSAYPQQRKAVIPFIL